MKPPSLSRILARKIPVKPPRQSVERLQLRMLRVQQGIWHRKDRAVIAIEGFDASGKGGAIRLLTEKLDPRGVRVHPIGPPTPEELANHWLKRFWVRLPQAGRIGIFDRSWYGRVLVERVEGLAPERRLKEAYREIIEFERALSDDGIEVIKIFLAVSKQEQRKRFESRLKDPYKHWKLTSDDLRARSKWNEYVKAADRLLKETHRPNAPWVVIPADDKESARSLVLETVVSRLKSKEKWIESRAEKSGRRDLADALRSLSSTLGAARD